MNFWLDLVKIEEVAILRWIDTKASNFQVSINFDNFYLLFYFFYFCICYYFLWKFFWTFIPNDYNI